MIEESKLAFEEIRDLQVIAAKLWGRNKKNMPPDSEDWEAIMSLCVGLDILEARITLLINQSKINKTPALN